MCMKQLKLNALKDTGRVVPKWGGHHRYEKALYDFAARDSKRDTVSGESLQHLTLGKGQWDTTQKTNQGWITAQCSCWV